MIQHFVPSLSVKCSEESWLVLSKGAKTSSLARSAVSQFRVCEFENEGREELRNEMNSTLFSL